MDEMTNVDLFERVLEDARQDPQCDTTDALAISEIPRVIFALELAPYALGRVLGFVIAAAAGLLDDEQRDVLRAGFREGMNLGTGAVLRDTYEETLEGLRHAVNGKGGQA